MRDLALLRVFVIVKAVRGRLRRVSLLRTVLLHPQIRPRGFDPQPWIPLLTMNSTGHRHREQEYGYLSYHHHIVLGLDEVHRLVHTVTEELGTRGLTTPFLFSNLALDVNSSGVRRLIQAFLRTCVSFPAPDAERTWHDEARFAAPVELAMCLRWGLARVLRVSGGNAVRGLLCWDAYVEWSEAELGRRFFWIRLYSRY